MTITMLKIDDIQFDLDTQVRAELHEDKIEEWAELMAEGVVFPPIVVFQDGDNLWLSEGWHRWGAAKRNKQTEIKSEVRVGTKRDAIKYAIEANSQHGIPLSNADKHRIVEIYLNDPEWSQLSNREIARRCGVSHKFVNEQKKEMEPGSTSSSEATPITAMGANQSLSGEPQGIDATEAAAKLAAAVQKANAQQGNDHVSSIVSAQPAGPIPTAAPPPPQFLQPTPGIKDPFPWADPEYRIGINGNMTNFWYDFTWSPVVRDKDEGTFHYLPSASKLPIEIPEDSTIFVCPLLDIFAAEVNRVNIDTVLSIVSQYSRNSRLFKGKRLQFLFLTRNPARYSEIKWPTNCKLGEIR